MTEQTKDATVDAPLPYVFLGTMLGQYRGQPCRVIGQLNPQSVGVYIEFADGMTAHVPRYVIRRLSKR